MRKALGARSGQIARLVVIESAYVGGLGGILGLFLGMAAILAITISQRWTPVFDVALLPVSLLTGLIVGGLGGGVAAIRAARAHPAESLRS